jgi:hypothetical protein
MIRREELVRVREVLVAGGNSSNQQPLDPSAYTNVQSSSMTNAGTSSSQVILIGQAAASGAMSVVSDSAANQMLIRDLMQHEEADVQVALMEMVMGRHAPPAARNPTGARTQPPSSPRASRTLSVAPGQHLTQVGPGFGTILDSVP